MQSLQDGVLAIRMLMPTRPADGRRRARPSRSESTSSRAASTRRRAMQARWVADTAASDAAKCGLVVCAVRSPAADQRIAPTGLRRLARSGAFGLQGYAEQVAVPPHSRGAGPREPDSQNAPQANILKRRLLANSGAVPARWLRLALYPLSVCVRRSSPRGGFSWCHGPCPQAEVIGANLLCSASREQARCSNDCVSPSLPSWLARAEVCLIAGRRWRTLWTPSRPTCLRRWSCLLTLC